MNHRTTTNVIRFSWAVVGLNVLLLAFLVGCDWFPTLASLADLELPDVNLDGKDVSEVLLDSNAASPHTEWYWQLGSGPNAQWAVREGTWKLLGRPRDPRPDRPSDKLGPLFLADLESDPGELEDQLEQQPEKVKQLRAVRKRWQESLADPSR